MNFFDLRKAFTYAGGIPVGKYELKDYEGKKYPTYSVAGLDNFQYCIGGNNSLNYYIDVYESFLQAYASITGKNVNITSKTGLFKTLSDAISMMYGGLTWQIDIHFIPGEANSVRIEANNGDDYILVDWGDSTTTQTNAEITTAEHTYAKEGDYHITVTLTKIGVIEDFISTLLDWGSAIINVYTEGAVVINQVKWPILYAYSLDNGSSVGTNYYFVPVCKGVNSKQMVAINSGGNLEKAVFGYDELPNIKSVDIGSLQINNNGQDVIKEITIQVIGADFSEYESAYPALTTLKVAPDDLTTFKTAVTAFNKGNTTATLTVLKGKHQEEAYQWATANGHFASIVKE